MFAILLFGLFFLPIDYLYGFGTVWLLNRLFRLPTDTPKLTLIFLTGLMSLSTLGSILSLFFPLQGLTLGIIVLGAILLYLWGKFKGAEMFAIRFEKPQFHPLVWLLLGVITLTVWMSATRQPSNPDTGLYHAQAIHWIETYPVVPGLGNLHHRFAYNSSWLVLNALFSLAFLGGQSFHIIPAILSFLVILEFIRGLDTWQKGNAHPSNILRTLLLPIFFYTQASEISSPGTDLPGSLFLWMIVIFWLEESTSENKHLTITKILIYALSIFAITIKLSTLPVLLFAGLIGLACWRDKGTVIKLMGVALGILLPWFARSVILSGYLIYPLAGIDVFHFDWKIPVVNVQGDQRAILAWARIPREDADWVLALPAREWIKIWFNDLTKNRKWIVLFCGITPLLMFAQVIWTQKKQMISSQSHTSVFIAYLVVLFGGLYWLFSAPDYRFGYGFLMLMLLFPLLLPFSSLSQLADTVFSRHNLIPTTLTLLVVVYQIIFLIRIFPSFSLQEQLLSPLPYLTLPTEPCQLNNRTIFCPAPISYSACFYDPFPCAPSARPHVALRGLNFEDGFRYVP